MKPLHPIPKAKWRKAWFGGLKTAPDVAKSHFSHWQNDEAPIPENAEIMAFSGIFLYNGTMKKKELQTSNTEETVMWLYRTSGDAEHPIVLYEYKPNRKPENAENFLKGFTGWLHADGYQGYHRLPEQIRVVGCFAHARRKFDEALQVLAP